MAYELELIPRGKIHNIFHVSYVKKVIEKQVKVSKELHPLNDEGNLVLVTNKILEFRQKKVRSIIIKEYLVQCEGLPGEDANWEGEDILHQ